MLLKYYYISKIEGFALVVSPKGGGVVPASNR